MMYATITSDGGFLVKSRAAAAKHLLDKRTPAHVATPFLRQRIVIDGPAVAALQHRITRGRFRMLHYLGRRLSAAESADPDMHHIVTIENSRRRQGIHGFQE
mgnify:CR=1 FL=1